MKIFAKIPGPKTCFFVIEIKKNIFNSGCVGLHVVQLSRCRCDAYNIIETETNNSIFTTQFQRVVLRFYASLKQQEFYDHDS